LRLDALWFVDTALTPDQATRQLDRIFDTGGHAPQWPWPYAGIVGTGEPEAYWTDELNVYWRPIPDATHTIRWYGFKAKDDITTRGATFGYPNYLMLPFASFAVRVLSIGIADDTEELQALAGDLFQPALRKARRFSREQPGGRVYSRYHAT